MSSGRSSRRRAGEAPAEEFAELAFDDQYDEQEHDGTETDDSGDEGSKKKRSKKPLLKKRILTDESGDDDGDDNDDNDDDNDDDDEDDGSDDEDDGEEVVVKSEENKDTDLVPASTSSMTDGETEGEEASSSSSKPKKSSKKSSKKDKKDKKSSKKDKKDKKSSKKDKKSKKRRHRHTSEEEEEDEDDYRSTEEEINTTEDEGSGYDDEEEYSSSRKKKSKKNKKKKSKKSKSSRREKYEETDDDGYGGDTDEEQSKRSRSTPKKSSSLGLHHDDDSDDDSDHGMKSTPFGRSTTLSTDLSNSSPLDPNTNMPTKKWIKDNLLLLQQFRPWFNLQDGELPSIFYRQFVKDAFITRDDCMDSTGQLNQLVGQNIGSSRKSNNINPLVQFMFKLNHLPKGLLQDEFEKMKKDAAKKSASTPAAASPSMTDGDVTANHNDDNNNNNTTTTITTTDNNTYTSNQSQSPQQPSQLYFGQTVVPNEEADAAYVVNLQAGAFTSPYAQNPAFITPFSLFVPPSSVPLSQDQQQQQQSTTATTTPTESHISTIQVRRSHVHQYYLRPWFPLWCIGQYILCMIPGEGQRCARVCDVDYDGTQYDLQLPAVNTTIISKSANNSSNSMVTHQSTIYLVVTYNGRTFYKIALNAVSNSPITPEIFEKYIALTESYRAECNAINAWLLTHDGIEYIKNPEQFVKKLIAQDKKEREPEANSGDINDNEHTVDPLIKLYHLYTKSTPATPPFTTPTPATTTTTTATNIPTNNKHLLQQPLQSQYRQLSTQFQPELNNPTSTLLTSPSQHYIVTTTNLPLSHFPRTVTTAHALCYIPTANDITYLRQILMFIERETIPTSRRDDFYIALDAFRVLRRWKNTNDSILQLEELKRDLIRLSHARFTAQDEKDLVAAKADDATKREAWCRNKMAQLEREIQLLTDLEREKQKKRAAKLSQTTVTTAGNLNAKARTTNKQRWNTIMQDNVTPSVVDLVYHENPQTVSRILSGPNGDSHNLSAVVRGPFIRGADILKHYTEGLQYTTTVDNQVNNTTAVGTVKRQRVTLGSVAQCLVDLNAVTKELTNISQSSLHHSAVQGESPHSNIDTPINYQWLSNFYEQRDQE